MNGQIIVAFQGEHGAFSEEAIRQHFGNDGAHKPDLSCPLKKTGFAISKNNVVIGHEEEGNIKCFRDFGGKFQTLGHGGSIFQSVLVRLDNHRAVSHRFGKGDLHLNEINTVFHHLSNHPPVHLKGRIAQNNMGHEQNFFVLLRLYLFDILSERHIRLPLR